MDYIEFGLLLLGASMLVIGYRKNSRNVLLAAAIVLFLSATAGGFVQGFVQGIDQWAAS
jgi:hypothetical protein